MPDILDPSVLLSSLPNLLPTPFTLNSPQDAIVVLIHGTMDALSFRLVGVDDTGSITAYANNILPGNWNTHGPGHYTLRYRHEQSSLEFVVKISKLATRTIVNAIAVESDKPTSLDIQTADFTSPSFFPYTPLGPTTQPLVHGFISSNRIADFVQSYKLKVLQKLVPGLRKDGYTEYAQDTSSPQSGSNAPLPQAPRNPTPPVAGPSLFVDGHIPLNSPLSIGRRDLDPLPAHPNPFGPPPLFGGPSGGDGMFVGPNHPIFSHRFNPSRQDGIRGRGQHEGPWGGDGFLPLMGAPPGARFDPVGPFGSRSGQGIGRVGPFGGSHSPPGPPSYGTREPDNDELMPPGVGDMFS